MRLSVRRTEVVESTLLTEFVRDLTATGEVSAAAAGVWQGGRLARAVAGVMDPEEDAAPVRPDTCFDIASLTKPFTATLALIADRHGVLDLDSRLGDCLRGLPLVVRRLPLASLLRHRAGLIPWFPFYSQEREVTVERFTDPRLWRQISGPHGSSPGEPVYGDPVYSDLGPILWSLLARREGLDPGALLAEAGFKASYAPAPEATAATALTNRREAELAAALGIRVEEERAVRRGVPQDGNARVLDQPGHAGLFASLDGVLELGLEWLQPRVLAAGQVEAGLTTRGRYALGWWRADPERDVLPSTAFGHNGFTGCSLWIEPERGRLLALLAHRTTLSDTLDRARREFHRLALELFL